MASLQRQNQNKNKRSQSIPVDRESLKNVFVDVTPLNGVTEMACCDPSGHFRLALKHFTILTAQKFYCIYLRKKACSFSG